MPLLAAALSMTLTGVLAGAPVQPHQVTEAQQRYKAGVELMAAGKCDEAAEQFKATVAIDPLMALAHYNLGQCHMSRKEYASAVVAFEDCRKAFERLSSMSQDEREARERMRRDEINELRDDLVRVKHLTGQGDTHADITELGMRMEERLRQLESMENKDRAARNAVPAGVYLALGSAYFRQGKLDDAEREYSKATDIDPRLGAAHNNLAVIYLMTGRAVQAATSMRLAEKNGFRVSPAFKEDVRAARQK